MRIIEIYKARSSAEAHCLQQILDEAGIDCQIAGDELSSLYGIAVSWNPPTILVSEEDAPRAYQLIEEHVGSPPDESQPEFKFQFGMRSVLVNLTLISFILGLYIPLGTTWPDFAFLAFMLLFLGNIVVFVHLRNKRTAIADEKDGG
jgi:Putative prokaryotic signal transducing protein